MITTPKSAWRRRQIGYTRPFLASHNTIFRSPSGLNPLIDRRETVPHDRKLI